MIVDDSALMRKLLSQALARDPGIEIIDTAMDGQFALEHLARMRPDVVLMDIDMPRLDGLATLDRIVADYALPVVMCSTRTSAGAASTLDALARGAVDFIEKPTLQALTSGDAAADITARVRGAASARVRITRRMPKPLALPQTQTSHAQAKGIASTASFAQTGEAHSTSIGQITRLARRAVPEIIAIGISTGGPPALEQVLAQLPSNFPLPIVIVQHMPAGFTTLLTAHLDRSSAITVREATDGEVLQPGVALVSPGGAHLSVVRGTKGYAASLDTRSPAVSGHRPSVDVLFDSVAIASRGHAAAVQMTGMGSDGAEAMGRLAAAGGVTIAQSPDSCICFGMPKSAIDRGYTQAVVPLEEIASAIIACSPPSSASNSIA